MSVKIKDVFVISEREDEAGPYWSKVGVAFVNKDNSLNVILDAVPIAGKLHIRDRKVKEPFQNQRRRYEKTNQLGDAHHRHGG